jgi:hypothetical protein
MYKDYSISNESEVLDYIAEALLNEFESDLLYETNWYVTFGLN